MRKRSEGYWGIHSDFHASPDFGIQGRNLKEEDIREICRLLKPDFWQIDSKGHPGWASYPTKIGNAMPEFACDTLEIWRRATKAEDVTLVTHYSGVVDQKYCADHPEGAVMKADGTRSGMAIRTNGPYVDDVLIPQISEMVEKYGVDATWVDGDCWGVELDYHPETVAAFERETGIALNGNLPQKEGDPYYVEYREFMRVLYRRYLKHYIEELHRKYPDFEITSNWMYSDFAMEQPLVDVDFLSGDFTSWNALNWARYSGRALAQQGLPWDLMAWYFRSGDRTDKPDLLYVHPAQLTQDAAEIISLGGGYQVDVNQYPDGAPLVAQLKRLATIPEFMRPREPFCFRGKLQHQVAMLLSTYDLSYNGAPYSRDKFECRVGLSSMLCDAGQSLEIVSEHTLENHYQEYPMIVVPELKEGLVPDTIRKLMEYANNGGSLVLVGPNTCRLFAQVGVPMEIVTPPGETVDLPPIANIRAHNAELQRYVTLDGIEFGAAMYPNVIKCENSETIAWLCYNERCAMYPFAVLMNYGQGKIAAIGGDIGVDYYFGQQNLHLELIRKLAKKMYTPKARIESVCGMLEIVCLEKNDRLMLQLVNVNGNHSNDRCATEAMIPPVLDIKLSIACSSNARLMLQPEGVELPYEYIDGRAYFEIDRINIHNIVEVIE